MKYLSTIEAKESLENDLLETKQTFSEKQKQQIIDARMWRVNSSAVWTEDENINEGMKLDKIISEELTLIRCAKYWNQSVEETRKDFAEMYESTLL